jgi:hypothetical protein
LASEYLLKLFDDPCAEDVPEEERLDAFRRIYATRSSSG